MSRASEDMWFAGTTRRFGLALVPMLLTASCGAAQLDQVPHDRPYQREAPPELHRYPSETSSQVWWETFYNSSFSQISAAVSPGAYLEPALGPRSALDVNAFGTVPDSSWFENRIGRRPMSWVDIVRGPNDSKGPAPGPLTVVAAKTEGVTPGILVFDQRGTHWVVKFDPPAHPDLSSAAEVISTKILYAAGYHVPENHIARFRLRDLVLAPGATTRDRYNRKIGLTREMMEDVVTQLNPEPDGSTRALFSRVLPGRMLGPFPTIGVRKGDPNDRIPHERRRSLRGLWVFYAWLNNSDAKSANTMDAFIPSEQDASLGHVRHYLIDFGSSLGASGNTTKPLREGYDYEVDWSRAGARFVTAGAYYPYWSTLRRTRYRSVGPFEADVFEPAKWRPRITHPAFLLADEHDTLWGASILARFTDDIIGAAVSTGEYSEPGAAMYVAKTLIERRDKLLAYAFREMLPLGLPRVERGHRVVLDDLEAPHGLRRPDFDGYRWRLSWQRSGDVPLVFASGRAGEPSIMLRSEVRWLRSKHASALAREPFLVLRIAETDGVRGDVVVRLRVLSDGTLMAIGMERTVG